jgi:hypothetical protein
MIGPNNESFEELILLNESSHLELLELGESIHHPNTNGYSLVDAFCKNVILYHVSHRVPLFGVAVKNGFVVDNAEYWRNLYSSYPYFTLLHMNKTMKSAEMRSQRSRLLKAQRKTKDFKRSLCFSIGMVFLILFLVFLLSGFIFSQIYLKAIL